MPKPFALKTPEPSEKELQCLVIQFLEFHGYTVLEIGKTRKAIRCYRCNAEFIPVGFQGNTVGAPDLLVSRSGWLPGQWIGIELKTSHGRVRPEQKALALTAQVIVCRSLEDVKLIIAKYEAIYQKGDTCHV